MVRVKVNKKSFDIDGILKKNLDKVKDIIHKDWDYLYIVDGEVGSGKSVFAQTLAWYCSNGKLTIDQIAFDPKQFKKAVVNAEKFSAIVFDEAFRGLSSRGSLTRTNRVIISMLQEIRQKNLFVFVVLPSVWDVDGYVSKHRMKGLFHVYVDKNRQRGYYRFFTNEYMRFWLGNTKNRYKYPKYSAFHGRFSQTYMIENIKYKRYIVGEKAYLKKKNEALHGYEEEKNKALTNREQEYRKEIAILSETLKKLGVTYKKQGELTGRHPETVRERVKTYSDLR